MPISEHLLPAKALTCGRHHFFGYYDKFPWDISGRYHLALETAFMDRMPAPDDRAVVGMVDTAEGNRFIPLDETTAWCWQQGTMLQWLGTAPDREIVYNVREGDAYVTRIRDVFSGRTRSLPRPVHALTSDGTMAATVNYSRIADCRPGYGYCGIPDPNANVPAPEDDGVWVMDMRTGAARLIVSLADLAAFQPMAGMQAAKHRVKHYAWNPAGTRLLFLQRWRDPAVARPEYTRLFTVNPDGSDLRLVNGDEMTSHYDWRDDGHILAWARKFGRGDWFYLFDARTGACETVGTDVMTADGHCSYSPDRRWILNDTYPQGKPPRRTLYVYRLADGARINLGHFDPANLSGPIRCDLHPRWSRDGRRISFDSVHEGTRQIYVMELDSLLQGI